MAEDSELVTKIAALSSVALTIGLALSRPHIAARIRVTPPMAAALGVAIMVLAGLIGVGDVSGTVEVLWQPFVTIGSIMLIAAAAQHLGVLERIALGALPSARASITRLFGIIFALGAGASAVLNNDSAILILTPLVVLLIRGALDEEGRQTMEPFVFAVFMAAGVAPMVVSNPMNMIVADYANIGFNEYAVRMLPVAVVGWIVSFGVLRWVFRRELSARPNWTIQPDTQVPWTGGQLRILGLLMAVVVAYPIASYFGRPIWAVAAGGASIALAICARERVVPLRVLLGRGIAWETLAFLLGVFVLAIGLRNAGIIEWLSDLYEHAGIFLIGVASAVGSAIINNHSMGLINVLAIRSLEGSGETAVLAALIGGDLGPRLLPTGSLAGLLWFASLRRMGIEISIRRFISVGLLVTVPSLASSLLVLELLSR